MLGVGSVFAVLVVLGGAYAVLRSTVQTRTTQLWKEQAEAFEARLHQVEGVNAVLAFDNDKLKTEKKALESRVGTLEQTVTAGPAIEALDKHLAGHHEEAMGMLNKIFGAVSAGGTVRRRSKAS